VTLLMRQRDILTIADALNSNQVQSFTYDALNRLTAASTNGVGQGQYAQSYGYDPATGNLVSKSDVGALLYSDPAHIHAATSAGANTYTYDANGNMISRNGQFISYDAENHLTAFAGKTWLYDGDGKRVAEINADGTATIFIGNYFEGAYPEPEPPAQTPQPPQPSLPYKAYLPVVSKGGISFEPITARFGTLYFYADGERIAMKKDGEVYYLYGDQLGSVSAVADGSGTLISRSLYEPWGTTRHTQGTSPTDYAYTGQMQVGDTYFYNAYWPQVPETKWRGYDPQLGRFMQADTIVPPQQGTQGFDRYAYINNNPVNGTDPTGMWMCGDQYDLACSESIYETMQFGRMHIRTTGLPFSYTISGSYDFGLGKTQSIDRYSEDVISPTVPLGHPLTWSLQFIDFTVRILEEFQPLEEYVAKEDLYWHVYVTADENEFEITRMSLWVPEETIGLRTIDFRTPELISRGQVRVNEVLVGPTVFL